MRSYSLAKISSLYYEQLGTMQMTVGGWRCLYDAQSVTVVRRTRRLQIIPRIIIGAICRNTRPGGISIIKGTAFVIDHQEDLGRFKIWCSVLWLFLLIETSFCRLLVHNVSNENHRLLPDLFFFYETFTFLLRTFGFL